MWQVHGACFFINCGRAWQGRGACMPHPSSWHHCMLACDPLCPSPACPPAGGTLGLTAHCSPGVEGHRDHVPAHRAQQAAPDHGLPQGRVGVDAEVVGAVHLDRHLPACGRAAVVGGVGVGGEGGVSSVALCWDTSSAEVEHPTPEQPASPPARPLAHARTHPRAA